MNGKTAKLIRKAVLVSLATEGNPQDLTRRDYRKTVQAVKERWKETRRDNRGEFRNGLRRMAAI